MTSKIVVNNIEADAGVSTVTFGSNIQGNLIGDVTGNLNSTGITTVTTLNVGTGASISSPSSNVLTLGTNNQERLRVGSGGHVGILSTLSIGTNTQVTSSTGLNPVITVGSATTSRLVWGTPGSNDYRLNLSGGGALVFGVDGDSENFAIEGHQTGIQHLKYFGIDNYGRVTMPYQPGCSVWYSGTDITSGTIVYDEVEFNTGSHYSTSNGRFTAPIAGRYLVLVNHLSNSTSSIGFRLYKNGSSYTAFWGYNDGGTTNKPVHFSVAVSLAASDYLTVEWANGTILGSANYHNAFTVYLLG